MTRPLQQEGAKVPVARQHSCDLDAARYFAVEDEIAPYGMTPDAGPQILTRAADTRTPSNGPALRLKLHDETIRAQGSRALHSDVRPDV